MWKLWSRFYSFWLAFRRALIDKRDTLVGCDDKSLDIETLSPETTDMTSNSRDFLDDLIKNCLRFVALQWSNVHPPLLGVFGRRSRFGSSSIDKRDEPNATKIDRVVEVLEELIVSGDMTFSLRIFSRLPSLSLLVKLSLAYTPNSSLLYASFYRS